MIDYKISAIPIPKIEGEIEHSILHKLLKKKLSTLLTKPVIYLVDKTYQLVEISTNGPVLKLKRFVDYQHKWIWT